MENLHLKETLREIHTAQTHQRMQSFGRPPTGEMDSVRDGEHEEDDLIAHFKDFDMAELVASPTLPPHKQQLTPAKSDQRMVQARDEVNRLEEECRQLKAMTEQMSKDLNFMRE